MCKIISWNYYLFKVGWKKILTPRFIIGTCWYCHLIRRSIGKFLSTRSTLKPGIPRWWRAVSWHFVLAPCHPENDPPVKGTGWNANTIWNDKKNQ